VKKTTIYLVYEPNEEKKNYCHETDENGIVFRGDENVSNGTVNYVDLTIFLF
jgi:hypothetical protein